MKNENIHTTDQSQMHILFEQHGTFDDIPACYQSWQSDEVSGERIVFLKQDLKGRNDIDLIRKVKASQLVQTNSPVTLNRNPPELLSINFNFSVAK